MLAEGTGDAWIDGSGMGGDGRAVLLPEGLDSAPSIAIRTMVQNCGETFFLLNLRRKFQISRAIHRWNALPEETVTSPTLELFKRLENHFSRDIVEGIHISNGD